MLAAYERAESASCDLVAFPELAVTGYPPEDLVLRPGFVVDNKVALAKLAALARRGAAGRRFVALGRRTPHPAAACDARRGRGTGRQRIAPSHSALSRAPG